MHTVLPSRRPCEYRQNTFTRRCERTNGGDWAGLQSAPVMLRPPSEHAVNPQAPVITRSLSILVGLALVLGFLYWARVVLIPVALAILLTFLLSPVVSW